MPNGTSSAGGALAEPVAADVRVAAHRRPPARSRREQLVVQKVAFHVARAFGDIEMNRVTPPTCTRVLLTAHQVVIVPDSATMWPVVGLREVLCADIAHRKQVCDVEVLRSRDGERCLVAIAAGDVDIMHHPTTSPPPEDRATVRNATRRLQRRTRQPPPVFEVAILGTRGAYDLVDARAENRYAITSVA